MRNANLEAHIENGHESVVIEPRRREIRVLALQEAIWVSDEGKNFALEFEIETQT